MTMVISVPGRLCVARPRSSCFLFSVKCQRKWWKNLHHQQSFYELIFIYHPSQSESLKPSSFLTKDGPDWDGPALVLRSTHASVCDHAVSSSTGEFSQFNTFLRGVQCNVSRGHFISAQTQSLDVLMTDSRRAVCLSWTVPACFYTEQTIKFYSAFYVPCSKWHQQTEHFIWVDETEVEKVPLWWSASKKKV